LEFIVLEPIFELLTFLESFFWGYIAFAVIAILGIYLTYQTRFFQFRALPEICKTFVNFIRHPPTGDVGVHPVKVFFASVGGMVGIGNIAGIVTALQLGGPGALFWIWTAAVVGALIKYSEIYLGLKHRVANAQGGYDGGPMYFLQKAFKGKWIPVLVCVLLCIYGAEVYQFSVVVDAISLNWGIDRWYIVPVLLGMVLYAGIGGVPRVAKISTWVMPLFILGYLIMCSWIIFSNFHLLPGVLQNVFASAFTGHAAIGGFAGSTMMLAIQNGMAGASYSADLGIGYDSIIQSESGTKDPARQARMGILGVFIDNIICTVSLLVVLLTGMWHATVPGEGKMPVQAALELYFSHVDLIMPIFLFILGYTTLISYFIVGLKCSSYLHATKGKICYVLYTAFVLVFFAFFDQTKALLVMRVAGAILLIVNLTGIFLLRKEITFDKVKEPKIEPEPVAVPVEELSS
jgi:AGCS family alanine or glycine:cation symporter